MDPTNNQNPIPAPGAVAEPVMPSTQFSQTAQPVQPTQPAQPVQPVQPIQPLIRPQAPVQPEVPSIQSQAATGPAVAAPVAPVIMPNAPHDAIGQDFVMPQPQSASVSAANPGFVNATDPITMPAPPKAPDPVEEELKAPLKAAEPVPGSIGSAISVPVPEGEDLAMAEEFQSGGKTPPNVSFTDPATNAGVKPVKVKKKTSKKTLIALTIVAVMVVIALATILILMMNGMLVF